MATNNAELMRQARESLKGKWWLAAEVTIIYIIITGVVHLIPKIGPFAGLIIGGPVVLGFMMFFLELSRNKNPKIDTIFYGFKKTFFGVSLLAYLLMVLFIFLWSLLLIVPGIIAAFSYSMTFFIISENDKMKATEAMKLSKKMMNGNKWKYFCLQLRFIGWGILSLITLGIGLIWFIPYIQTTNAKFYDDIKNNNPENKKNQIA